MTVFEMMIITVLNVVTGRYNEIHTLMMPCITQHFTIKVGTMSIGKHSDADYCKFKITYCYGLQMWIFSQTLWNNADQNLTIRTPQTRLNASVGTVPASPISFSPATHEAPTPLLPSSAWTGRMLSGQSTNKTSRCLLRPLWHVMHKQSMCET